MPTQVYLRSFPNHALKFFLGEKLDNWIFFKVHGYFPRWAVMALVETNAMLSPYDPMKIYFRDFPEAWQAGGGLRKKKGITREPGDYPRFLASEYHKALEFPIIDIEYLRQKPHPRDFPDIDSFPTRKYAHLDKYVDEEIEKNYRKNHSFFYNLYNKYFGKDNKD
jgi:hypothetical protein